MKTGPFKSSSGFLPEIVTKGDKNWGEKTVTTAPILISFSYLWDTIGRNTLNKAISGQFEQKEEILSKCWDFLKVGCLN